MTSLAEPTDDYSLLIRYDPEDCPTHRGRRSTSSVGYPAGWKLCGNCNGHGFVEVWNGNGDDTETCSPCGGAGSIKDLVRQIAGHRCVRCLHPFVVGQSGEWASAASTGDEEIHANGTTVLASLLPETEEASWGAPGQPSVLKGPQVLWSDCDERCQHAGPCRVASEDGEWRDMVGQNVVPPLTAAEALATSSVKRVQAAWRILTVHHLNEEKNDCRWWNLAALCQRCHLEIQGRVNMAQVWPHEHTEWFKPYAAGFYAATYLKEDLTRSETMERLDELLALERVG